MLASLLTEGDHPELATVAGEHSNSYRQQRARTSVQPELEGLIAIAAKWMNDNQGVVSVLLFAATLLFGWASGIFSALRRRPKFTIRLIDGPTFCCTFETGREHHGHKVHRTGIALYLRVANVGSAPATIEDVAVGYHWPLVGASWKWIRHGLGWFWLEHQAVILRDFHVDMGNGDMKFFPFLIQANHVLPHRSKTYLEPGQSTIGAVYFEQDDSWGACYPKIENGRVCVKVRVTDTFAKTHAATVWIPAVDIAHARRYNPAFGKTYATLRGETMPHDASPGDAEATPGTAPAPTPQP